MEPVPIEITMKFIAQWEYLRVAVGTSRLLCEALQSAQAGLEIADDVELAVSEACTNAIKHGCPEGSTGEVTVVFRVAGNEFSIQVKDQGRGFDMEALPLPDFNSHPEGGYGIYIIRSVMDEVDYRQGAQGNTLVMKKFLGRAT